VCIDRLRAEKRRLELRWADLSEGEADALEACLSASESLADYTVAAGDLVQKLLEQLSPEDRVVVEMMDLEGRNATEIKELTGMSAVAVRVRAFRARRKLRQYMAKLGEKR
jgi:RNA polymerase sigma-70 factor (ECF subfamily)